MGALMVGVSSVGDFVSAVGMVAQALIPKVMVSMIKNRFRISVPFSFRFVGTLISLLDVNSPLQYYPAGIAATSGPL